MKGIWLVFVFGCAGCFIGVFFYKKYKSRVGYFADMLDLIDAIIQDVRYRQDGLVSIFKTHSDNIKSDLKLHITEFLKKQESGFECDSVELKSENIKKGVLTKKELIAVFKFFNSLGKLDSATQLIVLDGAKHEWTKVCDNAKMQYQKYGTMSIKLGLLLGLGVGIVVV